MVQCCHHQDRDKGEHIKTGCQENSDHYMENIRTISPPSRKSIPPLLIPKLKNHTSQKAHLELNCLFRDRWYLKGIIGEGGYGQIYLAIDTKRGEEVAIKVEPRFKNNKAKKRMILEQSALKKLRESSVHVPQLFASGNTQEINFLVMQLLSANLNDLKKHSPFYRLSTHTVGRILYQAICAISEIHSMNFLHRDIKPDNFCFGLTDFTKHILTIVDFGLVRQFRRSDGSLRQFRKNAGFRGTTRYVSPRVHKKHEQCPADDLVSLVYSGMELLIADLPWKNDKNSESIYETKKNLEKKTNPLWKLFPESFQTFAHTVFALSPHDKPCYNTLQKNLETMFNNYSLRDPYDWEINYKDVTPIL